MILNYHQESDSPRIAVIGLHGWTGTKHSMVPVARAMKIQSAKWYIPQAPYKASAGQGYTWFSGSPDKGWKVKKTFNLLDGFLFKEVTQDDLAKVGNIEGMNIGICIRYQLIGLTEEEFDLETIAIVDDCCCD